MLYKINFEWPASSNKRPDVQYTLHIGTLHYTVLYNTDDIFRADPLLYKCSFLNNNNYIKY